MIFQIDSDYSKKQTSVERSELYSNIIANGHYVDCSQDVREQYYESVESNGSKLQRDFIRKDPSLKLNRQTRSFLTVLNVCDFTPQQLDIIIKKPSRLLVENKVNESPVYRNVIGTYAKSSCLSWWRICHMPSMRMGCNTFFLVKEKCLSYNYSC